MTDFRELVRISGHAIGAAGVFVILVGSFLGASRFALTFRRLPFDTAYKDLRRNIGRSILLGLEFLIAGDIIGTVVVDATLRNITVLALIILIRTFLGITLHLEVEGRWPWQEPTGGGGVDRER